MSPETPPTDDVMVLVLGRGVTAEAVVRIRQALTGIVAEAAVVTDPRSVRELLRPHLAALAAPDEPEPSPERTEDVMSRLEDYADRLAQARKKGDKERFEELFARSPAGVGIHEISESKTVTRVNDAEVALLGYERREQLVGRPAWEFIVMQEASQRAMDKKMSGQVELKPFIRTFARADGRAIRMVVVDRHIHDAKGNVVGICSVIGPADPA